MTEEEISGRGDTETRGRGDENPLAASPRLRVPVSAVIAAIVALFGLIDGVYLTIHHYTTEPVPCGEAFDCGAVLNSAYAEIGGIPLAVFGAAAYFVAFSLALLASYGNRLMWKLFTIQVVLMAAFTCWLLYLQAFVIKAWCQFCLISAGITFTLLIIAILSKFIRAK